MPSKLDPLKGRDLRRMLEQGDTEKIRERTIEAKAIMKNCGSVSNLF